MEQKPIKQKIFYRVRMVGNHGCEMDYFFRRRDNAQKFIDNICSKLSGSHSVPELHEVIFND
jgi:hypothetical protein